MAKIATESPVDRARLSAAERDIKLPPAIVAALPQFNPEPAAELSDLPAVDVDALPATPALDPITPVLDAEGEPLQLAGNWRADLGKGLMQIFGPAANKAGDAISNIGGPTLGAAHRTKKTLQGQQRARDEFVGPPAQPDPRQKKYQKKGEVLGADEASPAASTEPPAAPLHTAASQAQADAAFNARVRGQTARVRPPSISADKTLSDLVEPRRTELLSNRLNDFRYVGSQGDAKIPDVGNVHAIIESVARQLHASGAVPDAKKDIVTEEMTRETAEYLGTDPQRLMAAILNADETSGVPIIKGFGLSHTIMAVRNLLYSEVSELDRLAELASRERSDGNLLNFRQQLELVATLQANFKGTQKEIGRSLGIFRFPVDPNAGAQRDLDLTTLVNEFGGRKDMDEVVEAYLKLPVGGKRAQFAAKKSKYKRFTDGMYEIWIHIMLSSPVTHVKNTAGVLFQVLNEIPVGLAAATIGKVNRGIGKVTGNEYGGSDGHYVTYGDVGAKSFGMLMSLTESFGFAGRSYMTGKSPIAGSKLGDSATGLDHSQRTPAFSAEAWEATGWWGRAVDVIGDVATAKRAPTRALQFEDTLFKVVAQRGKLWELAFRGAREAGLKGEQASDFMAEFMLNPPVEAVKEADDLARYVSLQDELSGTPGDPFKKLARWGAMRWVMPFIKTPFNAAKVVFEHSPMARWTKNYQDAMASGDRVKIDTARARVAVGTAAAATVGAYCATGQLTGGGPKHAGMRAAQERQGWRPYSRLVDNPDGTQEYVSYAWAEPFSTLIGITCDMVEVVNAGHGEDEDILEVGAGIGFSFAKNLTSKTYMSGFSSFLASMQDPDRYSGQMADNFIRSAVPRVVAHAGRISDPQKRVTDWQQPMPKEVRQHLEKNPGKYPDLAARYLEPALIPVPDFLGGGDVDTAYLMSKMNEIKAQIPGWSETLPARYDLWGRPRVYDGAVGPQWMSPIFKSLYQPNEVDQELRRLRYSQSEHPDEYRGIPLTKEELEFYQRRAGELSWAALSGPDGLLNRDGYKERRQQAIETGQRSNSDTNKLLRSEVEQAINNARARAIADLLDDPELGPGFEATQEEQGDLERDMRQELRDRENEVVIK